MEGAACLSVHSWAQMAPRASLSAVNQAPGQALGKRSESAQRAPGVLAQRGGPSHQVNAQPLARGASPGHARGAWGRGSASLICASPGFLAAQSELPKRVQETQRASSPLRWKWGRDLDLGLGVGILASDRARWAGGQVQWQGREVSAKLGHHQSEVVAGDAALFPAFTSGPFFRPCDSETGT